LSHLQVAIRQGLNNGVISAEMQQRFHCSIFAALTFALVATRFNECKGNDCLVNQLFNVVGRMSTELQVLRQDVEALSKENRTLHEELAEV
jgi:hypothetical protein